MKNPKLFGAWLFAMVSIYPLMQAAAQTVVEKSYACGGAHGTSINSTTQATLYTVKNLGVQDAHLIVNSINIYNQNGALLKTFPTSTGVFPTGFTADLTPYQSMALYTGPILSSNKPGRITAVFNLQYVLPTQVDFTGPIPVDINYSVVDAGTNGFLSRTLTQCLALN